MINKQDIETYEKMKTMFKVTCKVCGDVIHGTSEEQLIHTFAMHQAKSKKHKEAVTKQDQEVKEIVGDIQ